MNSPLPLAGEAAPQARVRVENSTRESRNYFSVSHPHPNPLPPAGEGELRTGFVFGRGQQYDQTPPRAGFFFWIRTIHLVREGSK